MDSVSGVGSSIRPVVSSWSESECRKGDCSALRTRRTLNFEENVLQHIDENPSTSTRTIAHALDVSHTSVWRVSHEH